MKDVPLSDLDIEPYVPSSTRKVALRLFFNEQWFTGPLKGLCITEGKLKITANPCIKFQIAPQPNGPVRPENPDPVLIPQKGITVDKNDLGGQPFRLPFDSLRKDPALKTPQKVLVVRFNGVGVFILSTREIDIESVTRLTNPKKETAQAEGD